MKGILIGLCLVFVQACSTTPDSSNADSGSTVNYDGLWLVDVKKSAAMQYMPGNWYANCSGKPYNFKMNVASNTIVLGSGEEQRSASIDKSGKFKIRVPVREKDGSTNSRVTTLIGSFKKESGSITNGWVKHNMSGCTAKFKLKRA